MIQVSIGNRKKERELIMRHVLSRQIGEFRKQFWGGLVKTVQGKGVTFPGSGLDGFQFFLSREEDGKTWAIFEVSTGTKVGSGKTQGDAVNSFAENLRRFGLDKFSQLVADSKKI